MRPEPGPLDAPASTSASASASAPGPGDAGDAARLFVALELPDGVTAALTAWSAAAATAAGDGLRRVGRDALHVTLCFLGVRPPAQVGEIGSVMRAAASAVSPVTASLGVPLWLPHRRPRVLAVGLDARGPAPAALATLQAGLAAALHELGVYAAEDRPYLPHVTVARVRRPFPRTAPRLPAVGLEPLAFTADRVTLFRSRLGEGPARYEALETVVLG